LADAAIIRSAVPEKGKRTVIQLIEFIGLALINRTRFKPFQAGMRRQIIAHTLLYNNVFF
jgi:hypothetical protein